ncbi:MAG: hypothetical protein QOF52_1559 [Propionibacteriaceae bacterium]|nr:hypothetical protein [Propionibacteriaceae bacterium]
MTELVPSMRATLARGFHTAGDLILLHACFVVASLPVVTVVPAAIALQRSIDDILLRQETVIFGTYWGHLRWAVRRFLVVSLVVLGYAVLVMASIYLWASFDGVVEIVGLSTVLALGALCTGLYLSGLAWVGTSAERPEVGGSDEEERSQENWRSLWQGARDRFAAQPIPVILCVIVVFGWLLLLFQMPSLGLFGFGLVPAMLAYRLNRMAVARKVRG